MAPEPNNDSVTLRIIILAQGNRTQDDLFLVIPLTTTIQALKERIRVELPTTPSPNLQRLIYEGRPLLDGNATLGQILRLDQQAGSGPSSNFVIHLVIRQDPTSVAGSQSTVPQYAPSHIQSLGQASPMSTNMFPQLHVNLHDPPDAPHAAMHNQAHMIQHAMAVRQAQMAAAMREHSQQIGQQAGSGASTPVPVPVDNPVMANLDPRPSVPAHPELGRQSPLQGLPAAPPNQHHLRLGVPNTRDSASSRLHTDARPDTQRPASGDPALINATQSASTPTISPAAPSASAGPHVQHILMQSAPMPFHPHLPTPIARHLPLPLPSQPVPISQVAQINMTQSRQTMAWLVNSPAGPQGIVFAPGHGYFTTLAPISSTTPPPQSQTAQVSHPTPTIIQHQPFVEPTDPAARPAAANTQLARLPNSDNQPVAVAPGARPAPNAAPAQAAQQEGQAAQNDMLNFIIQRGWLFLRLYMFIFVLSESGTWRRTLMLGSAMLFCLLPRQNPLNDAFGAVRGHFDHLIGPPQLGGQNVRQGQPQAVQRQDQQGQQQQQPQPQTNTVQVEGGTNVPQRRPTRTMPTPEEAARRLLAQQERRDPNPILNALHTTERIIVMFLASLIPGVGERHVRAREEARRIVDEQERQQREEREARDKQQHDPANVRGLTSAESKSEVDMAQSTTPSESTVSMNENVASSSGMDAARNTNQSSLRQRNVE